MSPCAASRSLCPPAGASPLERRPAPSPLSLAVPHGRFVDPLWKLKRLVGVGSEAELKAALRGVHGFCDRVINERRTVSADDLESRPDMLSRFMLQGFSDAQLRDQVINFVLAGRDTTAILLTWTLFELAQHPEVVGRLREEAAALAAERRPSGEEERLGLEVCSSLDE